MALVSVADVQGWLERTKLTIVALDLDLLAQLESEILARLDSIYDTTTWLSPSTTPTLVKTIVAKTYASYHIDKVYSENQDEGNDYAARLAQNAESLIVGLVDRTIAIPGTVPSFSGGPNYYPSDASSALEPTSDDPSLGPAKFSMGKVF